MDKKAQIGKFMTGFAAFILIFVLMAAFIILSLSLSKAKTNNYEKAPVAAQSDLLVHEIEFPKNGNIEKMLVADAILLSYDNLNLKLELKNSLKKIVNEKDSCLGLAFGNTPVFDYTKAEVFAIHYKYENGAKINEIISRVFSAYRDNGLLGETSVLANKNGKQRVYIESYYGQCLEAEK